MQKFQKGNKSKKNFTDDLKISESSRIRQAILQTFYYHKILPINLEISENL